MLQIQWLPGLATTNTEWIWDDWYDTWNFPVSHAVTIQTCNVQRWSSSWILWEFSLFSTSRNSETTIQKTYFQMAFFHILWCRFAFCWFGRTSSVHPVYVPSTCLLPLTKVLRKSKWHKAELKIALSHYQRQTLLINKSYYVTSTETCFELFGHH